MDEKKQTVVNALPASGEISYEALHSQLSAIGRGDALEAFHEMRRKKEITVRTDRSTGTLMLFVKRNP